MAVISSDLKFYLTGVEPLVTQTVPSQSIGGHLTTTEYSFSTTLASSIDASDTAISLTTTLGSPSALLIDDEILSVSGSGTSLIAEERKAFDTDGSFHIANTRVFSLSKTGLFNNSFSPDLAQYRCIAIKNTNQVSSFYDIKFFLRKTSRSSKSIIRFALEAPSEELFESTATGGTTISLIDSSIKNVWEDNTSINSVLIINDIGSSNYNISRQIASFDSETGTFTFATAFPYAITAGTTYRIEQPPSSRVVSGFIAPDFGTTYITDLSTADSLVEALDLSFITRISGLDLAANEVVYIWFERTLTDKTDTYEDNRIIFTVSYKTS